MRKEWLKEKMRDQERWAKNLGFPESRNPLLESIGRLAKSRKSEIEVAEKLLGYGIRRQVSRRRSRRSNRVSKRLRLG